MLALAGWEEDEKLNEGNVSGDSGAPSKEMATAAEQAGD